MWTDSTRARGVTHCPPREGVQIWTGPTRASVAVFNQRENPAVHGGRESLIKDSLGDEEEQSQSNCCVGEDGKHLWQCGYSTLVWSKTTLPWT